MKRSYKQVAFLSVLALLVSGCGHLKEWKANGYKVGPNYRRPCAPTSADWVDGGDPAIAVERRQMVDWWKSFGDPVLEQLICTAYQQNLSLRAAGLRVLEAREQLCISALNLFPQSQTYSHQYSRNQISSNAANVFPGVQRFFSDYRASFDLSWELDIWGRLRRSIEAAEASLDSEIESYDDILVTLIGDVAATYIELRSFDERLRLAEQNVEIQAGSLKIAEARQQAGRVSELDVEQAKTNLADTRALIPALRLGRRQALNRLAILLGMTPYELEPLLSERGSIPQIPPEVVVGIPADLLRRRPDIRSVERQVAAQSAAIGIAEAELYPRLAINGQIGLNAENFSNLFASGSGIGTIGPGIQWNVLNYGRIKKGIRVEELKFQQAIVNYQNAVLGAHQEVEDALVTFIESKKQLQQQRQSAEAAASSVKLVNIQYREGEVDFGRVFVVESSLVQRQDDVVATKAQVAIAMIQAYKALGGGWQLRLTTPYRGCYQPELIAQPLESGVVTLDGDLLMDDPSVTEEGWTTAKPAEPSVEPETQEAREEPDSFLDRALESLPAPSGRQDAERLEVEDPYDTTELETGDS